MRVHPAAALFLLLGWASVAGAEVADRVARTVPLPAGSAIRLSATVADVTIVGSARTDVSVSVVRRAPSSADLLRYPVLVEPRADGLHIDVVQAADGRDAALKTEIVVEAPAAAVFAAIRVFEGHVSVSNLTAACDVDLRRGAVTASRLAGRIRLEAGLGSIDVRDSALTPGGMMRLRVFNGPVRVRFAERPASARILALTFNGSITSDIPLTMKDRFGPRFGETTLGSGDPVMSIDVVKGNVAISAPHL